MREYWELKAEALDHPFIQDSLWMTLGPVTKKDYVMNEWQNEACIASAAPQCVTDRFYPNVYSFLRFRQFFYTHTHVSFVHGLEKTHHAWCVFSKLCTLHCNHRSGHLKTEHTESLFLLRRHLVNWPRGPAVSMKSELLVAYAILGHLPLLTVYVLPV